MDRISEVNEKDWKLFRNRIGHWQEAYMDRLIHEYMVFFSTGREVLPPDFGNWKNGSGKIKKTAVYMP